MNNIHSLSPLWFVSSDNLSTAYLCHGFFMWNPPRLSDHVCVIFINCLSNLAVCSGLYRRLGAVCWRCLITCLNVEWYNKVVECWIVYLGEWRADIIWLNCLSGWTVSWYNMVECCIVIWFWAVCFIFKWDWMLCCYNMSECCAFVTWRNVVLL